MIRSLTLPAIALAIACSALPATAQTIVARPGPAAPSAIEAKYLKNIRQVTPPGHFARAGEGYFSPDGKSIIYQAVSRDYPFYQIYTQPLNATGDEARPRMVSTGKGRTTCAYFSRDGQRLLFASSHLDPNLKATEEAELARQAEDAKTGRRRRYQWDFDPQMDIFETDVQGKILRQLTKEKGYDAEGAPTPDGKQIVFCSDRDGDPDLYVMDADGSNVRQLTNVPGYDGGPFTSPDGKWVTFRTDRAEKDRLQIYVIGLDGMNETALTADPAWVHWAPYWHPTEPYLIWTGADHTGVEQGKRPNYDLWLMRYEVKDGKFIKGPMERVTENVSADVLPVFSPDGKQLMWTGSRTDDHSSQLFIADFQLPASK